MTSRQAPPSRLPKFLRGNPIAIWLEDAWDALQETADDAVASGRRAAKQAREEHWRRYDAKTKNRRQKDD